MSINVFPINDNPINDDKFIARGGNLIEIEQIIGETGAGNLIAIEQDVLFLISGDGVLITIEQNIGSTQSGNLIVIEQQVVDGAADTHVANTGWDVTLTVGSQIIPRAQIHGDILISRTESSTSLMDVTLIPPIGIQNVDDFIGQAVTLDVRTPTENLRIYTGLVDIPEIDLINQKITLRCADRREELINAQLGATVNSIGRYSPIIFNSEPKDTFQELEFRLSTTPTAVDFDAFGIVQITPWAAKATADFTFDDPDIYREKPTVEFTSRGRITNKVNTRFQYRFERLHHWERNFSWLSPIDSNICLVLKDGFSLTRRDMITVAVQSAGWPIKGDITFNEVAPSNWYSCTPGLGRIAFQTTILTGTTEKVVDKEGNQIRDSRGNLVFTRTITGGTDLRPILCDGATWTSTFRWAQSITETYSLAVQAPQSQTQFGTIEQAFNYGATANFDTSIWENYTSFVQDPVETGTYFLSADVNRFDATNAMNVALLRAKTTILGSHRDTRVKFSRSIFPQIGLKHTVELTAGRIQCKGKVFNITHRLNVGTGEAVTTITLVLSKAQGSQAESGLVAPPAPVDTVTLPTGTIRLDSHYAQDPATTAGSDNWTGFVGNGFPPLSIIKTNFTERFIVDTPAIPNDVRDNKDLTTSSTFNIEIPDDNLVIVFEDE